MKRIVVTGPESTGKSTLAAQLAARVLLPVVPEFARYYVAHLGRPYTRQDLTAIGRGQRSWELFAARTQAAACILDTDWTVLHIWELYGFMRNAAGDLTVPLSVWQQPASLAWRQGYGFAALPDLYFLCAPDFAWVPDPLREHPHAQYALFSLYQRLLAQTGVRTIVLKGDAATRLECALASL